MACYHRDGAVAARGLDGLGELAEDVLFLERVDERVLELVRHEVAAVPVRADLEHVAHGGRNLAAAHGVPEGFFVCVRRPRHRQFRRRCGLRRLDKRRGRRTVQLVFDFSLALETADFLPEILDVLFHGRVGGIILSREDALLIAAGVEKCLGAFPGLGTFCAKFVDGHKRFLLFR